MPERGEVWLAALDPVSSGEQGGTRPVLVVSTNAFNAWPVGLVIVVPVTTRARGFDHHVPIAGGGLDRPSFAMPEYVRSVAQRRLHDAGLDVKVGDPRRVDTYLKAGISPTTCFLVEDNGKRSLKKILEAIWDAGGTLVYVLGIGAPQTRKREDELKAQFPELNYLALSELFGGPLLTEFSRSLTRLKVQQYQRFFSDADRVVILLHNDPDPDAMASGLALRNVLRRAAASG